MRSSLNDCFVVICTQLLNAKQQPNFNAKNDKPLDLIDVSEFLIDVLNTTEQYFGHRIFPAHIVV